MDNILSGSAGNASKKNNENQSYPQFDECDQDCVFRNSNGTCLFETCMWDNEFPPSQNVWGYTCQICGKDVSKQTRAVRIHICDDCLQRLRKSAGCKECGNSPL